MTRFREFDVGTSPGTVFQAPQNYSVFIDHLYVDNVGTVNDELVLLAQQYNTSGQVTGTITIGKLSSAPGKALVVVDGRVEIVPAASYLLASSSTGNLRMTYSKKYVYYRE